MLNSLRALNGFFEQHTLSIAVIIVVIAILATIFGGVRTYRVAYWSLLITSPFLLMTFAQAAYRIVVYDASALEGGPLAGRISDNSIAARRVVWIVFDGWDAPLTFAARPPGIELPEVDRLLEESFYASNAVTAERSTDKSMPSLVSGIFVTQFKKVGPFDLKIRTRDSDEWLLWSRQPNVFEQARAAGYDTAVAAWAVPYCRVFKSSLSECEWWSSSNEYNSTGTTFAEILLNQSRTLLETTYRSPFGGSLRSHRHAYVYEQVLGRALQFVKDPGYGLILLHFPIPHSPYFYNAATGRNDFRADPVFGTLLQRSQEGYLSALVLMDKTIGTLRRAMEQAGTWDSSAVILTSDHPFRFRSRIDGGKVARTVPFLVKPRGPPEPIRYETAFSTVLTKELILAFLTGELFRSPQIGAWIDGRRADYPFE